MNDKLVIKRVPKKLKKPDENQKIKIVTKKNEKKTNLNSNVSSKKRVKVELPDDVNLNDTVSALSDEEFDPVTTKRSKPFVFRSPRSSKKDDDIMEKVKLIDEKVERIGNNLKKGEVVDQDMFEIDTLLQDAIDMQSQYLNEPKKEVKKKVTKKKVISKTSVLKPSEKKTVRKSRVSSFKKEVEKQTFVNTKSKPIKINNLNTVQERNMKYQTAKFKPSTYGYEFKNGDYYKIESGQYTNYVDFPSPKVSILIVKNNGRRFKIRDSKKKIIGDYTPENNQIMQLDTLGIQYAVLKNDGDIEFALMY